MRLEGRHLGWFWLVFLGVPKDNSTEDEFKSFWTCLGGGCVEYTHLTVSQVVSHSLPVATPSTSLCGGEEAASTGTRCTKAQKGQIVDGSPKPGHVLESCGHTIFHEVYSKDIHTGDI